MLVAEATTEEKNIIRFFVLDLGKFNIPIVVGLPARTNATIRRSKILGLPLIIYTN